MQIWFVFSLIFSLIVATFAVMNSDVVTVKFFWGNYALPQSAVILLSAVLGAAIATFLSVFSKIKSGLKIRELSGSLKKSEKENERLTHTVKTQEQKTVIDESVTAQKNIDEKKMKDDEKRIKDQKTVEDGHLFKTL